MVPARHVIVLQHVPHETPGLVASALAAQRIALKIVRPFRSEPVPTDLEDATGLVVMGGPMGVYEGDRFPFLRDEMKLIERALAAGCPVLGICLGSQLLAHVLGAEVRKGPRKEIGWHPVTLTKDGLLDANLKGLESSFVGFHWHGDVFDLPADSTWLARSELTACQAFRHQRSAYGLLFHMEVTREIVEAMVREFPDDMREVGLSAPMILEGADAHEAALAERGRQMFAGWADQVVAYADALG